MSLLESLVEMKAPKICLNLTITNVSGTNMNPINAVSKIVARTIEFW